MLKSILFFAMIAAVFAVDCTHITQDIITGATIQFLNLDKIKPVIETDDFVVSDGYDPTAIYQFRICENTAFSCNGQDTPVCLTQNEETFQTLGTLDTQYILDFPSSDKSKGVLIEYSNGTVCPDDPSRNKRVFITLECDPTVELLGSVSAANHLSGDSCDYEIYAKSQYACPEPADYVCEGVLGCSACTAFVGCGWCSATQQCVVGNEAGPRDGSACYGTRSWHYGGALDCTDCSGINSCTECNQEPDCKYCASNGGCLNVAEPFCQQTVCSCNICDAGQYCPDEGTNGGQCYKVPNGGGMFVGGMFLGFVIIALVIGAYVFYKKQYGDYDGL